MGATLLPPAQCSLAGLTLLTGSLWKIITTKSGHFMYLTVSGSVQIDWLYDATPVLICCKFSLGTFLLAPMRMRWFHLNCSKMKLEIPSPGFQWWITFSSR